MEKCVIGTTFYKPERRAILEYLVAFHLALPPRSFLSLPAFDMVLSLPPPNISLSLYSAN